MTLTGSKFHDQCELALNVRSPDTRPTAGRPVGFKQPLGANRNAHRESGLYGSVLGMRPIVQRRGVSREVSLSLLVTHDAQRPMAQSVPGLSSDSITEKLS